MDAGSFQPYGASHWLALGLTVACGWLLLRWFRDPRTPQRAKWRIRRLMAALLCMAVALDPVLVWARFGHDPALAWKLVKDVALPLHLCDVVSLVLAWALFDGRAGMAEAGFLWCMTATAQGLLTPNLPFGWEAPEYYVFFLQHGGAPVAAVVLAFGLGLGPRPGYFVRMVGWSWGYMAVVMALNWLMATDYGFLNAKPPVASLLDWLGPWPWYLLSLQAVAFSLYAALGQTALWLMRKYPPPAYHPMRPDPCDGTASRKSR